ncbi:hypothetical protein SAMD00019534_035490 [Acytostelium subglobosum LB1]|uniref:hypothetical protein n=1 Tax=Acytostelium subglobosum LB1 TaxID=1410327 RepID=UPI000645149B|nr:hypothetical protein SAMD00019534_035490 [Acytostelium subglobosum LB1]GAM20374.1 hypothetical protein SAMD00019534_035490 [Acytostelium subglobosum LB1]|eukprot:XP_012759895.1 hypothetical protein SAMD00019534_035490 [Acytostelium subglobosum LB1]
MTGTCQLNHPEYDTLACCTYEQSVVLKNNMAIGATIFGRCPACLYNIWDLWCASSCSPYQSTFMVPRNISHPNSTEPKIESVYFYLDPVYAQGLYNSCRDVDSNGAGPIGQFYTDYVAFFNGIFGANPAFKIYFMFDADIGYTNTIEPCAASCSCDSCRDSCVENNFNGLKFNYTLPSTELFNMEIPFLSIWFIYSYVAFIMTVCFVLSIYTLVGYFKLTQRMLWMNLVYVMIVLYISALIFPFAAGVDPESSSKCTYKMPYGHNWNCVLAIFVAIYTPLICILFAVMALVLYFGRDRLAPPQQYMEEEMPIRAGSIQYNDSDHYNNMSDDIGITDPSLVQRAFFVYGKFITRFPKLVILVCILFAAICAVGILRLDIEQDPVKLWASPDSRAVKEKAYFDSNFGPFYRTEQLIITLRNDSYGQVMSQDSLVALINLELDLMSLTTTYNGQPLALSDLCFQPTHKGCLVESVTSLWQRNIAKLESQDVYDYYQYCLGNLFGPDCMDLIGTPVNPSVVLGGWSNHSSFNATAFVTTFLLNNKPANLSANEAWEAVWLNTVKSYNDNDTYPFRIAYSSERSVQDELAREGEADIPTILISYSVMFLYVSLALGKYYPLPSRWLSLVVNSRFTLGLCGIIIVALSILISVGICSILGIKATMIISEVIPFLVLAIGVDNIFILVNTFESLHVSKYDSQARIIVRPSPEQTLARALAKVGPSMALASLSESLAFLLGTLTKMPAVVAFSFYASVAIFFDFLLQISAFAVLLVIDTKRSESRRIDCLPCIPLDDGENSDDDEPEKQPLIDGQPDVFSDVTYKKKDGLLKFLFKEYYAPFLVHPVVKVVVIFFFVGLTLFSISNTFKLELGLDQSVALPKDSYLQDYFAELAERLEVGPPFYIVIQGNYDYSNITDQNYLCAEGGCNSNSIINTFNQAPYVFSGIASWLDDYISWSQNPSCCQMYPDGSYCTDPTNITCVSCSNGQTGRPNPETFVSFLPIFLNFVNTAQCPVAGLAYQSDTNLQSGQIVASRFDGYHTTLRTQTDFINALKSAYWVADHSDLNVFVYSVFYVYFEQYLNIVSIAIMDILLALGGVLVVCLLLLANPIVSLIVVLCVGLVSIDLLGIMALWNVNLNAVSVVNVVMAIGISIEFCVHIAHTFIRAPKLLSRDEKAKFAISEVGASIVSGIFITKLLGVVVLGFSNSEIFQVYYFRMYISIVILGGLHGLVLLPVLLSLFGTDMLSFSSCFKSKKQPQIDPIPII